MRSFRTRLALMFALISGLIIAAFGIAGSLLTKKLLLESVDLQLAVPIDRISRDLHPLTNFQRLYRNADIVHGDEIEEGNLLLAMRDNRKDEWLYRNPEDDWVEQVPPSWWEEDSPGENEPGPDGFTRQPPPRPANDPEFPGRREARPERKGGYEDELADYYRPIDVPPEGERRGPPPHPRLDGPPPHHRGKGPRGEKGDKGSKGIYMGQPPDIRYGFLKLNDTEWRIGVMRDRGYTVIMGRNLSGFRAEMDRVLKLLLFAGPMALLASAIGGWLVASHAMKPVTTITDTASRITTRDLNDRIPAKRGEFLEFANLVSVLNGMMDRLEKGFTHAVRFSGDVSHELKTPLTIMQAELNSALKRCEPGSEEEESLRVIQRESHRLKSITGSLMLLSQAESGRIDLKEAEFSLSDEIADLAEDAEILCEKEGLSLRTSIQENVKIRTDQVLLHQALLNLVSNAIKYNEPGGWIAIELEKHDIGREATFRISNTGPGIPPEDADHIFERFYRVNKARDRLVDGFGLGLNLSSEIFKLLGCDLELMEATEEMTLFQVKFPLERGRGSATSTSS